LVFAASAAADFSPAFERLVITQTFAQSAFVVPKPANAGGSIKPCHYPHFDEFLARGCGRQNIAWGSAALHPRYDQDLSRKPADAGDSHWLNDDEMANNKKLPPASPRFCAKENRADPVN
jgi:hypothetical protein